LLQDLHPVKEMIELRTLGKQGRLSGTDDRQ
jgi:hypothetical protein